MQINIRFTGFGLVVFGIVGWGTWFYYHHLASQSTTNIETQIVATERPVVMPTSGGQLEIATVKAYERFKRSDTRQFWGIDLGTTTSQIQATVTYRYHIKMAKQWPLLIRGKICIVRTGEVDATLPVAFDTTTMEKYTESGWARFNKDQNLLQLERSMTPELQARALSDQYKLLAKDAGRQVVAQFVATWLLKEQQWQLTPEYKVVVVFPGETPPVEIDAPGSSKP